MSILKKKWLWLLIIIAIGGYMWYAKRNAAQDIFVVTPVNRGDISQVVSASATLLADQDIDLNFETA